MCGIAGVVQRGESPEPIVQRMLARLRHRGPDGSGVLTARARDWHITFGHTRLSIIDIAGGIQPMQAADRNGRPSGMITYNGEVYNFVDLKGRLETLGRAFRTRSDTEVVLQHFLEFGQEGLADLNGMFAFASWDETRQALVLARDRAGVKPLYTSSLPEGGLVFASELSALLEHPEVSREVDPAALAGYFFSDYFHGAESALHGVRKLQPGHQLTWKDGKSTPPAAFWTLRARKDGVDERGEMELASELRQRLEAAVERQMVADVPVGIFLSGGIDSSLVAALASRRAGPRLQTFSIGFEDPSFDESGWARKVAGLLGTDHTEEIFSADRMLETLSPSLDSLDEPMADPSILPTFLVSRLARKSVKVVLGGDGGDELWAGYPTYRAHAYANSYGRIPGLLRSRVLEPAIRRLPVSVHYQSLEWKAKRFALRWDPNPLIRHLRWMSNVDLGDLSSIFPNLTENPGILSEAGAVCGDLVQSALALDFRTYLPGSVLTKVDRAAMANSLEVRPPLLDNELIDFAFGVSSSLKMRGGVGKALLKRAAESLLPADILHRRKKGFGIPLAAWLSGPLHPRMKWILEDSPLWGRQNADSILSRSRFVQWETEHRERRVDRSKPLWALLVLDHWARRLGVTLR